jgi:hypothetical protein
MHRSIALLVLVGACFRHDPFPCVSMQVFPPKPEVGTMRFVHGEQVVSLVLPDAKSSVHSAGGGSPLKGLEGPTNLVFGVSMSTKTPNGELFQVQTKLGDIRALENGAHPVESVRVEYHVACERPNRCPHRCELTSADASIEITEAEGGPAVFPDAVTPNFHRKLRIRARAENVTGTLMKNSDTKVKPACVPVGYDLDVTVIVDKRDFTSKSGMCGG